MNFNIDPNHLIMLIGIVVVIILAVFYNLGKANGYAQALDELNRQQTANAFASYINNMAKGATYDSSSQG